MTYKISDVKLQTIITMMLDLGRYCTLKELAKVTGKLMSIKKATGPIVRISLHHMFKLMSDQVKKHGEVASKIVVELPDAVLEELHFIMKSLPSWNGFKIINARHGLLLLLPEESLVVLWQL